MTPLFPRAPVKSLWTAVSLLVASGLILSVVAGCGPDRTTIQSTAPPLVQGISQGQYRADLLALVAPPTGWKPEPLKTSAQHDHQIWISPTGSTAYGVLYVKMPWPLGQDLTLAAFLGQMRRTEGKAQLIEKENDPNLPGLRFVAEGGFYRVRSNLIVDGFNGWVVYAATRVNAAVDPVELDIAEKARESTRVDVQTPADAARYAPTTDESQ
jgi:hypothetical protein